MANYQQSGTFGQYFGYGSGMQYDGSSSGTQNKWQSGTNAGNQTLATQNQNQQQNYQMGTQNYSTSTTGTGYYGTQGYGQQQNYNSGSVDNTSVTGTLNAANSGTGSTSMLGNKSASGFSNALGSTNLSNPSNQSNNASTNSYSTGYGTGTGSGSYGTSNTTFTSIATDNNFNKSNTTAQNQMFGSGYGGNTINSQTTEMITDTTNTVSNVAGFSANNQAQGFGNTNTADAMGQLNQITQMFGNANNYGGFTSNDASGGNFGTGFNQQAMNAGMMTLLQQTLLQQTNNGGASFGSGATSFGSGGTDSGTSFGGGGTFGSGGSSFGSGGQSFGTGNNWGTMSDGSGGYYAAPADGIYQAGGMGNANGAGQGKKGKKWNGKDKQDFYGNRFAQMYTGAPGIMNQPQTGPGKQKRLMNGVRFNVKGEKVIDVEMPLALYSRWGQLRKFFSRQDTEVAKHLIEVHDEMCEECLEREHGKKKGSDHSGGKAGKQKDEEPEEEAELTEEELALRQVMGFGNFNTPKAVMTDKAADSHSVADVVTSETTQSSASSWETKAGFIGPSKPVIKAKPASESSEGASLSEEEKLAMAKLGWSVFSRQTNEEGDDDDDDDDENMDGGKQGSAD